jgi:hypothetical protein
MENTEIVWRHLLAQGADGNRRHESVSALAVDLGLPVSTTHKSLAEPTRIGAVAVSRGAGVRVRDPFRLAVLWAGKRRLDRDITATWITSVTAPQAERLAAQNKRAVLGGFGAVVARLGGNMIADYDTALIYTANVNALRKSIAEDADGSTTIIVAEPDRLLSHYGRVTPLHQAWVDLFNLPGWQAARFTETIAASWVADAA